MTSSNTIISRPSSTSQAARVQELEAYIQADIPPDLKQLLLTYDEVKFERKEFERVVDPDCIVGTTLERIGSAGEMLFWQKNIEDQEDFMQENILAFGESLGSPMICIGIRKENYGKIYVFDYDFYNTLVAESFSKFIESLT